jgi:hypothetical protein
VASLLATLERGDLLEQALGEWTELAEASRPKRERELARIDARIRKASNTLDRYFLAFEEGKLREEVCTTRIEELSKELASLEARRSDLIVVIPESPPGLPGPGELSKLRKQVQRSLQNGGSSPAQGSDASYRGRDQGAGPHAHQAGLPRPNFSTTVWIGAPGSVRLTLTADR